MSYQIEITRLNLLNHTERLFTKEIKLFNANNIIGVYVPPSKVMNRFVMDIQIKKSSFITLHLQFGTFKEEETPSNRTRDSLSDYKDKAELRFGNTREIYEVLNIDNFDVNGGILYVKPKDVQNIVEMNFYYDIDQTYRYYWSVDLLDEITETQAYLPNILYSTNRLITGLPLRTHKFIIDGGNPIPITLSENNRHVHRAV